MITPHFIEVENRHEGLIFSLIALALVMLNALPHDFLGWHLPMAFLPLAPLYAWSLKKGLVVCAPVALVMGLVQDILTGGSFGLWSMAFLAGCLSARLYASLFSTSNLMAWPGWIVAVFFAAFAGQVAASFSSGLWPPLAPLLGQIMFASLGYPLSVFFWKGLFSFSRGRKGKI